MYTNPLNRFWEEPPPTIRLCWRYFDSPCFGVYALYSPRPYGSDLQTGDAGLLTGTVLDCGSPSMLRP